MFNINPKKMQAIMKQLGMSQEEISAEKVIIEKKDGSKISIENPSVTKVKMQGEETFQITGKTKEEPVLPVFEDATILEEDIKTVMKKTGATESQARKTLEKTGDLAEAILKLSR